MITRRSLLLARGIGLLVAHRHSRGQPAPTTRRVGMLSFASEVAAAHIYAAFKEGTQDLGWLEGKNVEYRFVSADGDVDRLDALASELVGQKVEVIVVSSPQPARAAQRATKTIPIVMANISNAVGNRFVASLAKPGGNITGITSQFEEVLAKVIEILHEVTPGARRIAILLNESNPSHAVFWAGAQSACAA
jgi:putative ABC transport system substrate-binding protein